MSKCCPYPECQTEYSVPPLNYHGLIQPSFMLSLVGTMGIYGISFWLADKFEFFAQLQLPKAVMHLWLSLYALIFFTYFLSRVIRHRWCQRRYYQALRTGTCPACGRYMFEQRAVLPSPNNDKAIIKTALPTISPPGRSGIGEDDIYVGKLAEDAFLKLAQQRNFRCEYLEQTQAKYREQVKRHGFSIKQEDFILWKDGKAFPVEVKARTLNENAGRFYFSLGCREFKRLKNQQKATGTKIHLMIFERTGERSIKEGGIGAISLQEIENSSGKIQRGADDEEFYLIPVAELTSNFNETFK